MNGMFRILLFMCINILANFTSSTHQQHSPTFSREFGSNGTLHIRQRRALVPKTVCYEELGCFNTGPPFRLLSLAPLPPGRLRVTYLLFTRRNRNSPFSFEYPTLHTLPRSHFDPSKWTRVLVHGYLDGSYTTSWPLELKDALLNFADENVIFVDHTQLGTPERINYYQSSADTRVIGAELANVLLFLKEFYGVDFAKVHIIGHSLGAIIGGYAGERVKPLARITGLDPPGIDYRFVSDRVKLEPTDATFVDVIHSNPAPLVILGLGTKEDVGHSNFWPNGGLIKGCPLSLIRILFTGVLPIETPAFLFNCRHRRSIEIFLFSVIQESCLFVGTECTSYGDYLQGKCDCGERGERCSFMGMRAQPVPLTRNRRRRYYTKIALERPYCMHQYQVYIYLQTYGHLSKSLKAPIVLSMFGHHLIEEPLELNVNLKVKKQVNTFLITTFQHLGDIESVHISNDGSINSTSLNVEKLKVNYLFPAPKEETEVTLCPKPGDKIQVVNTYRKDYCHEDVEVITKQ